MSPESEQNNQAEVNADPIPESGKSWRLAGGLVGLTLLLIIGVSLHITMGSVSIPMHVIGDFILGNEVLGVFSTILKEIRLPRAITAMAAGLGLSVSGLLMQTLFRNPLAGPSVLGITSGASLGVALIMLTFGNVAGTFAIQQLGVAGSWLIIIAASLGSGAIMLLITVLAVYVRDHVTLLIIGIMVGYLTIALVSIWQFFSAPEQIQDYLIWTFGSLGGTTLSQLEVLIPVVAVGAVMVFFLLKPLNALLLGEDYARSVGIEIRSTRFWIILATSILAGSITAFCGPIGFVGIAVPHLVRGLLGTNNHRQLVPFTMLTGAVVLLFCDILAKWPGSSSTLPISAITSLMGAPIVIWIILRRRSMQSAF